MFFLERTVRPQANTGGPGPVSRRRTSCRCRSAPACSSCFQRPNTTQTGAILARFWRPESPRNSGQTSPLPLPRPAGGVVVFGTHLGATGGTQTHSRRTGGKLGQLHCARQGLVRVPESNTKYGGKAGKTGAAWRPLLPASISESSGIPKRKKLFRSLRFRLHPAVHRATIYCGEGVASSETHVELRDVRAGMPAPPMATAADCRQGAVRFLRLIPP